jgi:hypothetical protein
VRLAKVKIWHMPAIIGKEGEKLNSTFGQLTAWVSEEGTKNSRGFIRYDGVSVTFRAISAFSEATVWVTKRAPPGKE